MDPLDEKVVCRYSRGGRGGFVSGRRCEQAQRAANSSSLGGADSACAAAWYPIGGAKGVCAAKSRLRGFRADSSVQRSRFRARLTLELGRCYGEFLDAALLLVPSLLQSRSHAGCRGRILRRGIEPFLWRRRSREKWLVALVNRRLFLRELRCAHGLVGEFLDLSSFL